MNQTHMNQRQAGTTGDPLSLNSSQRELLRRILETPRLPLEDVPLQADDVGALVALGLITMAAVQYPWGIDFELVAAGRASGPSTANDAGEVDTR